MIEVYVIMTLLGIGYYVNQYRRPSTTNPIRQINVNEIPSQQTQYKSNFVETSKKIEALKAAKIFDGSIPNVIPRTQLPPPASEHKIHSNLSGVDMTPKEFVHNNMIPFYRGSSTKQNMSPSAMSTLIENYTGVSGTLVPKKKEVEPLFNVEKNLAYVHGAPHQTEKMRSFIHEPVVRNNTLPFKQLRVGPGLNDGYSHTPTGGFQQFDVQEIAKPKTVDEMRTKTNPKVSYEGRIVDGQKGTMLGKIGKVNKNRVDTSFENSSDRYLTTTGAYLKPTQHGVYNAKETSRQSTTTSYTGGAYNARRETIRSDVRPSARPELGCNDVGVPTLTSVGKGTIYDYGKSSILVYANERDVTSTKTYQGNITSVVKAVVAPLQDMFRVTKKELTVEAPREFGSVQVQIPSKAPTRDPSDVTRTTLKETLVQETDMLNLKGASKTTVYCKDDVARTTIKETTIQDAPMMNLKGVAHKGLVHDPNDKARMTGKETLLQEAEKMNVRGCAYKSVVYDPNDKARTTGKETLIQDADLLNLKGSALKGTVHDPSDIPLTTLKETLLQEADMLNIRGAVKGTVHDPNDIPRTTVKETLVQEIDPTNVKMFVSAGLVYDPEEIIARTTGRETMKNIDTGLGVSVTRFAGKVYDPNDKSRTTIKETTIENDYVGSIGMSDRAPGGYQLEEYDAKPTNKQELSEHEYFGGAENTAADGYKVAPKDLKCTIRQTTSDREYYGNAGDQNTHMTMSYDAMYNACISELKESVVTNRDPVKEGTKVTNGGDAINFESKKSVCDDVSERVFQNRDRIVIDDPIDQVDIETLTTRDRNAYPTYDRLDLDLLEALKDNPYVQRLIDADEGRSKNVSEN